MYDVIIIGKGPAGIQAGLYTARAKLKTLILGKDSVLLKSKKVDNYCCTESQSGDELLNKGVQQVKSFGAEVKEELVVGITKNNYFEVTTERDLYQSKAIIIASGQPAKRIPIDNIQRFEGMGVHYCSTCDGFFYDSAKVGILGYTDYAIQELREMQEYTKDLILLTNGKELDLSDRSRAFLEKSGVPIITKKISSFEGVQALEHIKFEDGSMEDIQGVFFAYGTASSLDFARKLGIMINSNVISTDKDQRTNIPGLFAAGDCTGGFKQISTAVGQGALAGKSAIEYIINL